MRATVAPFRPVTCTRRVHGVSVGATMASETRRDRFVRIGSRCLCAKKATDRKRTASLRNERARRCDLVSGSGYATSRRVRTGGASMTDKRVPSACPRECCGASPIPVASRRGARVPILTDASASRHQMWGSRVRFCHRPPPSCAVGRPLALGRADDGLRRTQGRGRRSDQRIARPRPEPARCNRRVDPVEQPRRVAVAGDTGQRIGLRGPCPIPAAWSVQPWRAGWPLSKMIRRVAQA